MPEFITRGVGPLKEEASRVIAAYARASGLASDIVAGGSASQNLFSTHKPLPMVPASELAAELKIDHSTHIALKGHADQFGDNDAAMLVRRKAAAQNIQDHLQRFSIASIPVNLSQGEQGAFPPQVLVDVTQEGLRKKLCTMAEVGVAQLMQGVDTLTALTMEGRPTRRRL